MIKSAVTWALSLALVILASPISQRELPPPISADTARTYLAALTVAPPSNVPPYRRALFPHWHTVSGKCNTREVVLQRDGVNVVQKPDCSVASGTWLLAYDGTTTTSPADIDIDHLVPLREAWVSGAKDWTTPQREAFANDLTRPQLIAAPDRLNVAKGDKDPARWMPPLASYACTYVRAWIEVKYYYKLSIDPAEKASLQKYLNAC